jgi:DNA invertase Pin-like site-specific DNA recombinase
MSAKAPGRPIFNAMIARIERGEADGIIAWAPDRLARNSIDGGRIVYLLDTGALRDLKFLTYTFENNSQGKFMLSIMFGQSKYYSDALSENVKRGNRTKAALGWRPGAAPIGYVNDPTTKTIKIDPAYFPLVRRMFDLVITGGHSAREVARIAREDWHLTSPHRRRGGGLVHDSMVHRLLTNPFYAGLFVWEGKTVTGRHQPVVTLDEFRAVQAAIMRPGTVRPKRHTFAFAGLIRCVCGRAITAEEKVNRYGSRYVYYHCARSGPGPRCAQPAIRAEALEEQIEHWLRALPSDSATDIKVRRAVNAVRDRAAAAAGAIRQNVERALRETRAQITELTTLRLRRLLDDEEFGERRRALQSEAARLAQQLDQFAKPDELIPPLETLISFSTKAADWFRAADYPLKRTIVRAACSHLMLADKKLSVEAAKWVSFLSRLIACPILLGLRDDVRTFSINEDELEAELRPMAEKILADPVATEQATLADDVVRRVRDLKRAA